MKESRKNDDEKNTKPSSKSKAKKSPTREQLERQKLQLEIDELNKKWWKQAAYLRAWLPPVASVIIILGTLGLSGFFDRQREKLQKEKSELKNNIDTLANEKDKLTATVLQLKMQEDSLLADVQDRVKNENELKEQITRFKQEVFERKKSEQRLAADKNKLIVFYKGKLEDYERRLLDALTKEKERAVLINELKIEKERLEQANKGSTRPPELEEIPVNIYWDNDSYKIKILSEQAKKHIADRIFKVIDPETGNSAWVKGNELEQNGFLIQPNYENQKYIIMLLGPTGQNEYSAKDITLSRSYEQNLVLKKTK